jgi:hypothetical protein
MRKGILVVHIVSAGTWIGIDVVMGVVIFTALLAEDGNTRALCYRALELFAVWPLFTTGLVCLASGIVLGIGTKWGLVGGDQAGAEHCAHYVGSDRVAAWSDGGS